MYKLITFSTMSSISDTKCLENKLRTISMNAEGELDSDIIVIRPSDGFMNATKICKQAGVLFKDFLKTRRIKEFLSILQDELGLSSRSELVDVTKGGCSNGSWAHPAVITRMAQWISEDFGVKVSIWIDKLKAIDPAVSDEYTTSLECLVPTYNLQIEADVRKRLALDTDGTQCVIGRFGEIDLVTEDEVIEIKFVKRYTHALGQVLGHSKSLPGKKPRVHFFGTEEDYEDGLLEHIGELYEAFNVKITYEVVILGWCSTLSQI